MRRRSTVWHYPTLLGLVAALALCLVGCDQNRDALNELREQQKQILAKLTALEKKLDRAPARPAAARPSGPDPTRTYTLPIGNSATKGPADAPITIVEFSDYQCPYCARSEPLIGQVLAAYPAQTRFVYKQFPLVSIHPQAMPAALAAVAAGRQGKFWEMHDLLFANQRALSPEQIREYARKAGLDLTKFDADLASDEVKAAVQEDMALAQRVGVRGTPSLFVNGRLVQVRSLDGFKQIIEPLLNPSAAAARPRPTPPGG
ncbi:MAG: thioredoxin domain-containing protein [bacterium]